MNKLLSDYTNKTLTEFEQKLFLHVLVKQPTKDELLLRNEIRKAFL